jgi:hypothetical protein
MIQVLRYTWKLNPVVLKLGFCTKKTNTIPIHATNINEARIRYWYFMFLSLTNVKISIKDFNLKLAKFVSPTPDLNSHHRLALYPAP